jgi:Transglycosylase SLT domain
MPGRRRSSCARPGAIVGGAVAATVAALLLGSCADGDPGEPAVASPRPRISSPVPSAAPSTPDSAPTTSSTPDASDATSLRDRLDQAVTTVRDRHASDDAVRQAAEFQQLAVRALALGSPALRRQVIAALGPAAARQIHSDVHASRLLTVITAPKRRFPPWQVVAPPRPAVLMGYYREAERRTGVPWAYLAAIHLVETRMGRIRGPSTAGALGPMQFMASTWARYGAGGDIEDPHDAIQAAGRLLAAYGAPDDMSGALWHYNPSARYVGAVTAYARTMQRSTAAYRGYWHWRVLYRRVRGTYVLPEGYPGVRPVLLEPAPAGR